MWTDDDGVLHTVALPDPSQAMTRQFLASIDSLIASHRDEVREVVTAAQEAILAAARNVAADESTYVGVAPPAEILRGDVASPGDVRRAIDQVPQRWRLDAVMALLDYADGEADDEADEADDEADEADDEIASLGRDLRSTEERLHLFDALSRALVDPHALLDILLEASDREAAELALRARYGFDHVQAWVVLDHQLWRITRAGRARIRAEREELHAHATRLRRQLEQQ